MCVFGGGVNSDFGVEFLDGLLRFWGFADELVILFLPCFVSCVCSVYGRISAAACVCVQTGVQDLRIPSGGVKAFDNTAAVNDYGCVCSCDCVVDVC